MLPNPAFDLWLQQDQMILSTLLSSLSKKVMAHVVGLATSHEVWTTLDRLFSSQSQARILRIQYQLSTLQKGNLSISDYYQRAKTLADTLAAIGQPLQDSEVVSYILGGLDSTYDSLVTSITTRVNPISSEDLFSHLLSHEQRIERNHATPDILFPSTNAITRSSNSCGRSTRSPPHSQSSHQGPSYHGHNHNRG